MVTRRIFITVLLKGLTGSGDGDCWSYLTNLMTIYNISKYELSCTNVRQGLKLLTVLVKSWKINIFWTTGHLKLLILFYCKYVHFRNQMPVSRFPLVLLISTEHLGLASYLSYVMCVFIPKIIMKIIKKAIVLLNVFISCL